MPGPQTQHKVTYLFTHIQRTATHRGQKTAESAPGFAAKRRAGAHEVVAKRAEAEQARAETGAADKAAKEVERCAAVLEEKSASLVKESHEVEQLMVQVKHDQHITEIARLRAQKEKVR